MLKKGLDTALAPELLTYSDDVYNELNLKTTIKIIEPNETTASIKDYILDFYHKNNLSGVLLIGNVPSGEFYIYGTPDSVFKSQGYILGDYIYQDIENACVYSENKKAYSYENVNCQNFYLSPYWVARLTPNSSSKNEIILLKDYFHRNHAYRTGNSSFQNKILIYNPILSDVANATKEITNMQQKLNFIDSYSGNRYVMIDFKNQNSDSEYLQFIKSGYESILFNGHGLPTFHQKNIRSSDITNTNFFLANILSCSVGRFTTPDYLAGNYLFNGGLIVLAASTPVFSTGQPNMTLNFGLTHGLPFYKAVEIHGTGASNILGDPTLKMRYDYSNKYNSNSPILSITDENGNNITDIHFSNKNPIVKLIIKNNGASTLKIAQFGQYNKAEYENPNSLSGISFNQPFHSSDEGFYYLLDSGKSAAISLNSAYFLQFSSISSKNSGPSPFGYDIMDAHRTYSGKFFFLSNDPEKPYIEIPFDITKI